MFDAGHGLQVPLRIGMVAPLHESVPPRFYGGTERVVSYLTEALVALGHEVTLFASADSRTAARLRPMSACGLRLDTACTDPLAHHFAMLDEVTAAAREFDVLHFHTDYLHFPLARALALPALTTLHGRLDLPDLVPLYRRFHDVPVVSISEAQRAPLPWVNWAGTVHHGLPRDLLPLRERRGEYLAFLGRISPEKRPDRAIRIARAAGLPLRIAAKVDKVDLDYHRAVVEPLLAAGGVEFVGEIGERDKAEFLGRAKALLFPIDWPEPFGLVMLEAMACGTPVLAWPCGSVPEVLREGVSGWIVASEAEAVARLAGVDELDRRACRAQFEARFTAERMARDYLALYARAARRPSMRSAA